MPVSFEVSEDIPEEDLTLIVELLNQSWKSLIVADPAMVRERLLSGNPIIVAYDNATPKDHSYIWNEFRVGVDIGQPIPVCILEMIDVTTGGRLGNLPKSYTALTNNGRWRMPAGDADTRVLVDITRLETRVGTGIAKGTVRYVTGRLNPPHLWTFSPAEDRVARWHESCRAINTGFIIERAPRIHFSERQSCAGRCCNELFRLAGNEVNEYAMLVMSTNKG